MSARLADISTFSPDNDIFAVPMSIQQPDLFSERMVYEHTDGLPLEESVSNPRRSPHYPNQAGAGEQRQESEEARPGITALCESAQPSRQTVCREGGDCNSTPLSKNQSSDCKTGYVASEDSCQVPRPTHLKSTSALALESVDAQALASLCLSALKKHGPMTPDEVAAHLGLSILSIHPRMSELSKAGLIVKTGVRRANVSGCNANEWRAV